MPLEGNTVEVPDHLEEDTNITQDLKTAEKSFKKIVEPAIDANKNVEDKIKAISLDENSKNDLGESLPKNANLFGERTR